MARSSHGGISTFTNLTYVTPEVTIGLRSVQSRATWYLVRLGTVHVRRSLGTTDLREAKSNALKVYQAWLDDPTSDWLAAGGITPHHISFKQCAEHWLATQARDRSYKADVLRKFLLPFFDVERNVTNIATINSALIDDYKLWRRTFWLSSPNNPEATAARRANIQISKKQIEAMEAMEEPSPRSW